MPEVLERVAPDLVPVSSDERWRELAAHDDDPLLRLMLTARARSTVLTDRAVERIVAAIPAYAEGNVDLGDLRASVARNLDLNLLVLAERREALPAELMARSALGARRAESGLPISDLLRAFRVGYLVLWEALTELARDEGPEAVDRLLEAAGRIWDLLDRVSEAVADSYRETVARQDADLRRLGTRLVEGLERGELTAEVENAARTLGFDPGGAFVCATTDRLESRFDGSRLVVVDQPDRSVVVVQPRSASRLVEGWVAERLAGADGTRCAGVGQLGFGLAGAARSLREAERLRHAAGPGGRPLVWREDWFRCLVREAAASLEPLVADAVAFLRTSEEGRETLAALVATSGNLTAAARELHLHANSVAYRLARLEESCGLEVRTRDGLLRARLALELVGGAVEAHGGAP